MNERKKSVLNTVLTIIFVTTLVLFVLAFSIAVPIYCRFFYYIQINTLNLPESTGWSYETIKTAYDDALNYLTLPGYEFATGELRWTESEKAHFADCKILFSLDFYVMLFSGIISLALAVLQRRKIISLRDIWGFRPYFCAGIISAALPALIIIFALIVGFDSAFIVFHWIFFPGKANFTLDPRTEQIILIMPSEFFLNCGIIIGVSIVAFSASFIAAAVVGKRKARKIPCENSADV